MGLRGDLDRFHEVGEQEREDLSDFIKHGNLGNDQIKIPIKIVELPEFEYSPYDQGGVGQGDGDVGDPVDADPEKGDDGDEAGDGGGEHGYYEMNPEEFAQELDEELGLDLDPKGKSVKEEVEGAYKDMSRTGPDSTLDFETMFKKGLKRKIAFDFDEDYLKAVLQVRGMGVQSTFEWARERNIPVSREWVSRAYDEVENRTKYDSIAEIPFERDTKLSVGKMDNIPIRKEDERYRYPEIVKKMEKNVVVVNIRDVSGSMGEHKRELVERVFTPMDWYLTGKYDNAEFIYIAHDAEAWEVEREDFFGIQSGGGTKISSAYKLAQKLLEKRYPFSDWNRYVFAAGDGENSAHDSTEEVIPLMQEIDANLHAYLEVSGGRGYGMANHADVVEEEIGNRNNVTVSRISQKEDVLDSIEEILSTEDDS